jgi:hypothetical protein
VKCDRGQATVELVLVLPFVLALMLGAVQVALVARDQVLTVHAARAGAREAAVGSGIREVTEAVLISSGFEASRTSVLIKVEGQRVAVTVTYTSATSVPVVGVMVDDRVLSATVVMRREG